MAITISIELLVVLVAGLLFLLWFAWYIFTNTLNRWRYKPEDDKGRKSEEARRSGIAEAPEGTRKIETSEFFAPGSIDSGEERRILETAASSDIREDSNRPRGFFGRIRRKR